MAAPDMADLVAAVDFSSVGTAIVAIGAVMMVPQVIQAGIKLIWEMIDPNGERADNPNWDYDADESFRMMDDGPDPNDPTDERNYPGGIDFGDGGGQDYSGGKSDIPHEYTEDFD